MFRKMEKGRNTRNVVREHCTRKEDIPMGPKIEIPAWLKSNLTESFLLPPSDVIPDENARNFYFTKVHVSENDICRIYEETVCQTGVMWKREREVGCKHASRILLLTTYYLFISPFSTLSSSLNYSFPLLFYVCR